MNNEKEMQAMVKRLSKASAKKALEKECAEAVSSAVGRAYIMPSGIPKVMATLKGKPEMTKHD